MKFNSSLFAIAMLLSTALVWHGCEADVDLKNLDSSIDNVKHIRDVNTFHFNAFKDGGVGHHFYKAEASAKCGVKLSNRTVCGIHRTENIYVIGNAKRFAGIRQDSRSFFGFAKSLGIFNERNQFAKDF